MKDNHIIIQGCWQPTSGFFFTLLCMSCKDALVIWVTYTIMCITISQTDIAKPRVIAFCNSSFLIYVVFSVRKTIALKFWLSTSTMYSEYLLVVPFLRTLYHLGTLWGTNTVPSKQIIHPLRDRKHIYKCNSF